MNCNVKVVQQGLADVKTVKFGRLEWMDRSLGATLRASQAYANDIRSFGYLYQWGRTVPFPVQGEVEVVSTQMSPAEALASKAFISWTGETQDWNAEWERNFTPVEVDGRLLFAARPRTGTHRASRATSTPTGRR